MRRPLPKINECCCIERLHSRNEYKRCLIEAEWNFVDTTTINLLSRSPLISWISVISHLKYPITIGMFAWNNKWNAHSTNAYNVHETPKQRPCGGRRPGNRSIDSKMKMITPFQICSSYWTCFPPWIMNMKQKMGFKCSKDIVSIGSPCADQKKIRKILSYCKRLQSLIIYTR